MRLADVPIRRKLLAMALVITAIVLMASCAVLVCFDLISLRKELMREFGTLDDVVAANSTAALAFGASDDAEEILRTLVAERSVLLAELYDQSGNLFASYATRGSPAPKFDESLKIGSTFRDGELVTVRPVLENGRRLGMLVLHTDLHGWYQRLWIYVGVGLSVVGLAFLAATVFSKFLRTSITEPIDELARIARIVSEQGNFSVRARRFGNDELGALTETINHMLSQIQQRESALIESEIQRRLALEAAGLGTWRYDPATQLTTRDASLNAVLGLSAALSSVTLEDLMDRVAPEDREKVRSAIAHALDHRTDLEIEYRVVRPDGSVRWVRDRGRVLMQAGAPGFVLSGAVMDITERKASEEEILRLNSSLEKRVEQRTAELEESNKNLEAFAYSVSHDLRAPLRIIAGYTDVLLEDRGHTLPDDHKLCLNRIVDGTRKMNRLIDDLLQFSRLGQQPLKLQPTWLDRVIDDVLAELERESRGRRIEWSRPPLPQVRCDPSLIRQVFSNLLSNAMKYSRPRDPALIELGHNAVDGQDVIYVRDNGVGFDSAASTRLFGVFQRLHSAQEFEGNGVGLATAARIVRRHGGKIWAESKPGHGATFFFSLPKFPEEPLS
ncbi:MAG TPA: ATP-binding protein [Opitutaceae bacterium]|nr:ATP-binding protein [Opitutaceae bacterium]